MRRRLATAQFAIVATFVIGHWSTVNAGSSIKVVTNDAQQAQTVTASAGSSIQVVTVPIGNVVTAPAGSSIKVEPLPGERVAGAPLPGEPRTNDVVRREQIVLPSDSVRQVILNQPYTEVVPSNPEVVDFLPINNVTVVLKALKVGNSDVLFFTNGKLIRSMVVTVDDFVSRRGGAVPDPEALSYGTMEVHNKRLLTEQTNFRCGPDGCHFVGEVTVSEPAPLPRGYYNNTNTNTNSGTGLVPVPTLPTQRP